MYGGDQALAAFVKDVASLPVGEAGVSSIKIGVEVSLFQLLTGLLS
jgi:hypothetical protein